MNTSSAIPSLGPWFHNLHLPDGSQTAPDHPLGDFPRQMWEQIAPHLPDDLRGWTVLDIGCNAGFYSFELAQRGAEVTAIDHDPHYLSQARWAAEQFGLSNIQFRQMTVYELAHLDEQFDLVWFMGVLYHLRYPLLGLDIVSRKVRRKLIFQTMQMPGEEVTQPPRDMGLHERDKMREPGWPVMAFIEHNLAGDPTNWWAANHACVAAMLRACGIKIEKRITPEINLCTPAPIDSTCPQEFRDAEYEAVVRLAGRGRQWA